MRRPLCLLACLVLLVAALPAAAQSPLRVLLTTGGHAFQEEPFYALFDSLHDIRYTKAEMPAALDQIKPGLQKDFDVLVMYDLNKKITPEQQQAFDALLQEGMPLVSLHHNLGANFDWPQWRKILGGQFVMKPVEIDGREFPKSTWSHGEELHIHIADPQHPITKGLADFVITDESYGGLYVSPDVHVLLTTDHPKNSPQLCWTHHYGRSPVVCLQLGHDHEAYENPNYRELVGRAIRWAAAEKK